ncbi:MAG: UDP-N-acetylglucosamine 2-epimerase [Acidobacteriota bacterium]
MGRRQRRIAFVTTSRADYGHLYWPMQEVLQSGDDELCLIALGSHLSPEFGRTVEEIEKDGFPIADRIECLLSSDTDVGMAKTIGLATLGLADSLGRLRPDLLVLIADRYEMLAPASTALALRIPIVHIEGGEVSEGAIDEAVRNALTKMSHVHLTPTEMSRRRVLSMGEEPWRVHRVGAPSLDHLFRQRIPSRSEIERDLGVDLRVPTILVLYHPVTLAQDTTFEADSLYTALGQLDHPIIFCFPNADAGSRALIERSRRFCRQHPRAHLFVNLSHLKYWALLRSVSVLVGNSSSGIMETPSLALPTVNVGIRQRGRERARNILDVEPEPDAIRDAVSRALRPEFRSSLSGLVNPYGDGHASERIARILREVELGDRLLRKPAVPLTASNELHPVPQEP